ncbi:MAG TPA: GMP/IMP nucleotidase [Woeseiaceae bacterium]|nr:GMP/IMP nucleotidase [Woeseiaceae bacterium]
MTDPQVALANCDTLMLDMDGTVLDLAFDNYVWKELIPSEFAKLHGMTSEAARKQLLAHYRSMQGKLDWYCLDHWSERLGLDILAIHRTVNHRIGFLPGARQFLEAVAQKDLRLLLVTNSHPDTLALKAEVTGVTRFFDAIYSAHEVGHAKEDQSFWHALKEAEGFDPQSTLFVDDTVAVLQSAADFGIGMLVRITRPDSTQVLREDSRTIPRTVPRTNPRTESEFAGIESVAELLR